MREVSEKLKSIYNSYIATTRSELKQPFKLRKDFSTLKDSDYVELCKLENLTDRSPNIRLNDFFAAPFRVNGVTKYIPLSFYNTYPAINAYTRFKKVEKTEPDNIEEYVREGLKFVLEFCKTEKIKISQYAKHGENIPSFVTHVKNHKTNFFVLHLLKINPYKYLEPDMLEYIIPDFQKIYKETYNTYIRCDKLKEIKEKINKILS